MVHLEFLVFIKSFGFILFVAFFVALFIGVVSVFAKMLHAVFGIAQHNINLKRHQLLHIDKVGEVRDPLKLLLISSLLARISSSQINNFHGVLIIDNIEPLLLQSFLGVIERINHFLMSPLHLLSKLWMLLTEMSKKMSLGDPTKSGERCLL